MFNLDFSKFRKVDFFGLPLYIDPKYNYIAMASHGDIYGFMTEPLPHIVGGTTGYWYEPNKETAQNFQIVGNVEKFMNGDWRETLIKINKDPEI